jgi:hypothetical protein
VSGVGPTLASGDQLRWRPHRRWAPRCYLLEDSAGVRLATLRGHKEILIDSTPFSLSGRPFARSRRFIDPDGQVTEVGVWGLKRQPVTITLANGHTFRCAQQHNPGHWRKTSLTVTDQAEQAAFRLSWIPAERVLGIQQYDCRANIDRVNRGDDLVLVVCLAFLLFLESIRGGGG